ncbi:MAG: trypsin-like peptidase domain-containing protein, partial [Planctomycetota bacterium]
MRWFTLMLVIATATVAGADSLSEQEQTAIQRAAEHAAASVVQIQTVGGLEKIGRVLGNAGATSGVVASEDGHIISSAFNFITQPASIIVTLPDGSKHAARIVSRDRARMLVLLKIDADQPLLEPDVVPRDALRVGQWAIAVGKTYDPATPNISVGIVSATNRIWGRAIQTDAKVSPVNYGGALVDIRIPCET